MLQGLKREFELAGASVNDLVSVQIFCTDLALYATFNAAYRTYFNQGFPSRTFVGTPSLLFGSRSEIDARSSGSGRGYRQSIETSATRRTPAGRGSWWSYE